MMSNHTFVAAQLTILSGMVGDVMPSLAHFAELSTNEPAYLYFCTHFLKPIVGNASWRLHSLRQPLSTFVTVSDEAFALLTLENNYARWCKMWEKRCYKSCEVAAQWTNAGVSKANGQSKRFFGWKPEGYRRFNELYINIKKDRETRATFEGKLQEQLQTSNTVKSSAVSSSATSAPDEIFPAHDLFAVTNPRAVAVPESVDETDSVHGLDSMTAV
jgi:hypothetical protein